MNIISPNALPYRPLSLEQWGCDYIFENEWQSFRTKKDCTPELKIAKYECPCENDTMNILGIG